MTDITLEQRAALRKQARELLAAKCRTHRYSFTADNLDEGNFPSIPGHVAIAAVVEAMRLSAGADWVLVPREPTVGMVQSAVDREVDEDENLYVGIYRAMLASAPRHETGEG